MSEAMEDDTVFVNVESVPIEIEEINSINLGDEELSQFVVAETIPVEESCIVQLSDDEELNSDLDISLSNTNNVEIPPEEEADLIKKLINGELTFSEYNAQIGRNIEDIEPEDDDRGGSKHQLKVENFEEELFKSRRDALKGNLQGQTTRDGKNRRKRCTLPPALQGLMGEANLCYARGDVKLAEKVCLEIIRQVPLAHEPFLTLAQIFEVSDPDKHMQFSIIAAHLNPGDVDQWVRIAELSIEQKNIKQAISSFKDAIKASPKDIDLRMRRIQLLESIGEEKFAFRCYCAMLPIIPKERNELLLNTAKMIARRFLKDNLYSKALDAMNIAYEKISSLFSFEDINLYLELLIAAGIFKKVLSVLCNHSGLVIEEVCNPLNPNDSQIMSCIIPDTMILDFRTKLCVAMIHLQEFKIIDYLLNNIIHFINVEEDGDCYLDIAEALMKEQRFLDALRLLELLVKSKNFSLAAVWLRYADCQRSVGNYNDAINSYKNVVKMAPQHLDARLTLSSLLKKKGNNVEALKVLEQDIDNDLLDPNLLYERCYMLKETGNVDKYIDLGFLLISRDCLHLRNRDEMTMVVNIHKHKNKWTFIKELRQVRCENVDDVDLPEFCKTNNEPTVELEWNLYKDIIKEAYNRKRYNMMQKISFTVLSSKRFSNYINEMEFIALLSCIYNKDPNLGYDLVKDLILKNINVSRIWNLFNAVIQITDEIRYRRFLVRIFQRMNDIPIIIHILRANYCLVAGTYKYAINDYLKLYKTHKLSLLELLISITLLQMASQKYTLKKSSLITQCIAFLHKYENTRESDCKNEVYYNMGRTYHQMGMFSTALYYYKECLAFKHPLMDKYSDYLDLRRHAAFNIHLIYKNSGNTDLARKYLCDYVVV